MRTGFCRYCRRDIHNDNHYFGYCGISCCQEFASEQNISFPEAKDIDFGEVERGDLEDRIAELECSHDDAYSDASYLRDDLDEAQKTIMKMGTKIEELADLDWEDIKKEREREEEYNESVLRKVNNIRRNNDYIKGQMAKIHGNNILLKEQNLDLLNSIKELRGLSERFRQLDLGIELDYDE